MTGGIRLLYYLFGSIAALWLLRKLQRRVELSFAKHRSLTGHPRMARRLARLIPFYEYDDDSAPRIDGAPAAIVAQRESGLARLAAMYEERFPKTRALTRQAATSVSDLQFTGAYRVPFQFRTFVGKRLRIGAFLQRSSGPEVVDLDGNRFLDLTGSYGVNVFGYDFYRDCIDRAVARARELGPVLGSYHPVVAENAERLRAISGLDEVSFHMSGTEAVMQAVRLARYHTRRTKLVRFCGAYHGWWGDVQPGVGNPATERDTYTLRDMSAAALNILRTRKDIACVLINPLQALHPNSNAPGDSSLVDSSRIAAFDRTAYTQWLRQVREVCTQRGIVLIFDEVFVGFRLARGGAQEYFGVRADMVTYGKTLGGGLPIGAVCGRRDLMKRYDEDRPVDICFARGTFNSHPYVMAAANEFLRRLDTDPIRAIYASLDETWDRRAAEFNTQLVAAQVPLRIEHLSTIWTISYTTPSAYNWMFQFYLRAEGLALSWVGTGRLIFSLDYDDAEFAEVTRRFVAAARAMQADGWWWTWPSASNRAIRRRILKEVLAHRFAIGAPASTTRVSPAHAEPSDRSTLRAADEVVRDGRA